MATLKAPGAIFHFFFVVLKLKNVLAEGAQDLFWRV